MRLLCSIWLLLLAINVTGQAAPASTPKVAAEPSGVAAEPGGFAVKPAGVAVVFALKSARELQVPWQDGLTIDAAIQRAGGKQRVRWKEAWRYRESFWTRNFRNPHSFWARVLAGERASGYTHFVNSDETPKSAALKPGDRIYVDLAPIL